MAVSAHPVGKRTTPRGARDPKRVGRNARVHAGRSGGPS